MMALTIRPGPTLVAWLSGFFGAALGALVVLTGVIANLEDGWGPNVQAEETGQVQLIPTGEFFENSFSLRALLRGIPGVEAVSARLEFPVEILNPSGEARQVLLRGVNFAQEDSVIAFRQQIRNSINGAVSGLLVPTRWQDDKFLFPSGTATLVRPPGLPKAVPVNGAFLGTSGVDGRQRVILDLETARALLGRPDAVTSFVIRLRSGLEAGQWIRDHQNSVRGHPVVFRSWKEASAPLVGEVERISRPLILAKTVLLALFALLALSHLLTAQPTRLSWWAAGFVAGAALGAIVVLLELTPGWMALAAQYPGLFGRGLSWAWSPEQGFTALAAVLLVMGPRAVSLLKSSIER